jgi:hypothetical protein
MMLFLKIYIKSFIFSVTNLESYSNICDRDTMSGLMKNVVASNEE